MNKSYVWRLWDLTEKHLLKQIARARPYDRHLTFISIRELRFAVQQHYEN